MTGIGCPDEAGVLRSLGNAKRKEGVRQSAHPPSPSGAPHPNSKMAAT